MLRLTVREDIQGFKALFLAHLTLVLGFAAAGHFEYFQRWVSTEGYAHFASDSFGCHEQALVLMEHLREGSFSLWWEIESRFHTRLASCAYFLWGRWVGYGIVAYWPINSCALFLIWKAWSKLVQHIRGETPKNSKILLFLPILLLHSTQLLRDPLYLAALLLWIHAWISLFKSDPKPNYFLCFCVIISISPFVFWVRERFWVLAQLMSIAWLGLAILFVIFRQRPLRFGGVVFILALLINISTVHKITTKLWYPELVAPREGNFEKESKPFTFFYKIAHLRQKFISSYAQASCIDHHIHFENDADVINYLPRAAQISLCMPFPSMWFEGKGKTGLGGRLLSGYEMIFMWGCILGALIVAFQKYSNPAVIMLLIALSIISLALGLVVTNGGALYRMRFCCWLLWLALFYSGKRLNAQA